LGSEFASGDLTLTDNAIGRVVVQYSTGISQPTMATLVPKKPYFSSLGLRPAAALSRMIDARLWQMNPESLAPILVRACLLGPCTSLIVPFHGSLSIIYNDSGTHHLPMRQSVMGRRRLHGDQSWPHFLSRENQNGALGHLPKGCIPRLTHTLRTHGIAHLRILSADPACSSVLPDVLPKASVRPSARSSDSSDSDEEKKDYL
jgi:hypothetical protein